jgi:hypothetical protein
LRRKKKKRQKERILLSLHRAASTVVGIELCVAQAYLNNEDNEEIFTS